MVIYIPLSKTGKHKGKYEAIIDDCDEDIAAFRWQVNDKKATNIYAQTSLFENGKRVRDIRLHQMIMEKILGHRLEPYQHVDHIDGNGLNNTRSNIRICVNADNVKNRRLNKNNALKAKGVYKRGKRYRAQIQSNGKKIMLGTFDTPELAHVAYCQAADELHKEFANHGT